MAQPEPWLKPNWASLERPKMAVHQRLPSNLTELERICKEEWQRIPKSRCEKLVASFPKRLMAVLNQKGASTKYWAKSVQSDIIVPPLYSAESVTNGRDFSPSVTWTEGQSETARLERLFMIYWFHKKTSGWIFNIYRLVVFTQCGHTTVFKHIIKVIFA